MAIRKIDLSYFVFYIEKISFRWAHPEVQDDLLWIRCHDFRILLVPIAERSLYRFWKYLLCLGWH